MNTVVKNQIISELDNLPDQKAYSLLDYLHFLMKENERHYPNQETIDAINELEKDRKNLKGYHSVDEMFDDLGIDC